MKIEFKGISANYTHHSKDDETSGILIVDLPNGVQSTHIIENWGYVRIFQYVESMRNLI